MDQEQRNRLRQARIKAELSQVQLAERLGVTPGAIRHWESGATNLYVDRLIELAQATGVSVSWILGEGVPELTHDENELLSGYRQLPEDEKEVVRVVVRRMAS